MKKILIIRFSSIGDIVLTTPVIRCVRKEYPKAEIHFLTKSPFATVVENNPSLNKVWTIQNDVSEVLEELKKEGFDFVLDLHKNIRSKKVARSLDAQYGTFDKLNIKKWLLTNFKIDKMPDQHIVERYLDAGHKIGIRHDNQGLDFFINPENQIAPIFERYIVFVVGAAHATKSVSISKSIDILNQLELPVVLIGGKEDVSKANSIIEGLSEVRKEQVENTCGEYSIQQSASCIQQSLVVITPDTGMMHIASALKKPIVSIWGNTVPEFGMYPYLPENPELVKIIEVKDLSCRPCSKIGYNKCPKKHFKCITDINVEELVKAVKEFV